MAATPWSYPLNGTRDINHRRLDTALTQPLERGPTPRPRTQRVEPRQAESNPRSTVSTEVVIGIVRSLAR